MNVEKRTTITLLGTEIVELVAAHLAKEGYKVSLEDIHLNVELRWTNDGLRETPYATFKNCTAVIKGE